MEDGCVRGAEYKRTTKLTLLLTKLQNLVKSSTRYFPQSAFNLAHRFVNSVSWKTDRKVVLDIIGATVKFC